MNKLEVFICLKPKQLNEYYSLFNTFVENNYMFSEGILDKIIRDCLDPKKPERVAIFYIDVMSDNYICTGLVCVHSISSAKTIEDKYLDKFLKLSFALNISLEEYLLQLYRENKLGNQL